MKDDLDQVIMEHQLWNCRYVGLGAIHLKDMAIIQDHAVTAEIGEGNMNYGKLIQTCRDTGVEWYVVEQDECRRDLFESLAISYRNLQAYL